MVCTPTFSQLILNNNVSEASEAVKQISTPSVENILFFQTFNQGINNYASAQQIGNLNKTSVSQQKGVGSDLSNKSYTVQLGNSNELTIGQFGSGNTLLGFQLGYFTYNNSKINGNQFGYGLDNDNGNAFAFGHNKNVDGISMEGIYNKLSISQNGNNNFVLAVQQGSDNKISAEQVGNNNYLLAYQKGSSNVISDFKQENESDNPLYDRIIQIGENLIFSTDKEAKSAKYGNEIMQTGTNLSLQINNELLNTDGGIEINQKGNDMKVIIDQSYFSFPMK